MKKVVLLFVLFIVSVGFIFGQNTEQEEIDYLLFLPNSGNQFVDEVQAGIQLDNVARYLRSKNLTDAQIHVYGYTADVVNDIDSVSLSRERALHVISELQRRGISRNFFSDPVGYGPVNLWGSNANEAGRSPNRRARILFEDIIITPEVVQAAEPVIIIEAYEEKAAVVPAKEKSGFNWWWLLLLLPLLLLLLLGRKKDKSEKPAPAPKPVAAVKPAPAGPKYYRLTEEEIRNQAYKIFEERYYQHGHDEADWLQSINELTAKYEAQGYIVLWP